jgi:hypothetical protein
MSLVKTALFLLFLLGAGSAVGQWGGYKEWMGLIDQSCSTTFKGKAKRLFGELEFWVEVNVSMGMWIEDMRVQDFPGDCRASYQRADQREDLMRCLASVKRDYDWYGRCKPAVDMLCRQAGGRC